MLIKLSSGFSYEFFLGRYARRRIFKSWLCVKGIQRRLDAKACILVKTDPGRHGEVLEWIVRLSGVRFAFRVCRTDIVVNVEATG